jgi:hypothetical protein
MKTRLRKAAFCVAGLCIMSPAGAIELNGSLGGGGVSAGVGAKVDSSGVSGGVNATAGPVGVSTDTKVDPSNGGVSAGATVAAGNTGLSGGVNTSPTNTNPPAAAGQAPPVAMTAAAAGDSSTLPTALIPTCSVKGDAACDSDPPDDNALEASTPQFALAVSALKVQPTAPLEIVTACRNGVIQAALPFDPVHVDAVSAGGLEEAEGGGYVAPLIVRIVYDREGGYEIREAEVTCQVDAAGVVVSLA